MPLNFLGMDLTSPVNRIPSGRVSLAANVRAYFKGGVTFRNLLTGAIYTLASAVHSLKRLNDSTPAGPSSGYSLISGAGTVLNIWNTTIGGNGTNVATGLSGNPISIIPFRPNASVRAEAYIGDSAPAGATTLSTTYLGLNYLGPAGTPVNFVSNGMMKVSSTGRVDKSGVKEPQVAPVVSTTNTTVTVGPSPLLAKTIPWTNYLSQNSSYNYTETQGFPGTDGASPFIVDVANATSVTITAVTGTATINGGSATYATLGPSTAASTNPGHYIQAEGTGNTPPATATVVIGAFTDGSGNVVPVGVAPLYISSVFDVGANIGTPIPIPYGAQVLQIGINTTGNGTSGGGFNSNSGQFLITVQVTTNALPSVTSILGNLTINYWGDSPPSPAATYVWKNTGDSSGSGPTRTTSNAVGNTTGNSFIFDALFGTSAVPSQNPGIPGLPGTSMDSHNPSVITVPMEWTVLNPDSVAIGTNAVFQPAIKGLDGNTAYQNFNFCLTGSLYFPQSGHYTLVLSYKDDVIWGIGGGVTLVSSSGNYEQYSNPAHPINNPSTTSEPTVISAAGQTITVVGGYPLLPRISPISGEAGNCYAATVVVNVPGPGIYPIELDYDYYYHSGRILLLMADATPGSGPTIIPPLPANVREQVQYRYVYRSSATGATSNPSPESSAESVPVVANTVTSLWSNDPQVDVVDYYRIDSVTASFTYVATGPNDGLNGGSPKTNTPITDSLLDTELGGQLLNYDNFEPFPSIDLPQSGVCNVSGGVITWVSGGAIGGTATGFNPRWLAGTVILIGSPTSLAYVLIARPVSNTITIPGVPNGSNVAYQIPEPILANQPLPYMAGPTDNINYTFAVGDPLRPGTLYWCAGSNLDSAPDTNQQDVTDPSEALVNVALTGGLGILFSIRRGWLILPNSAGATATALGTSGSPWTLQESSITRGLYIPRCLCVSGGGNVFFRVDDGIHISRYGSASQSISDHDIYPLFAHENQDEAGSQPQPITRNGVTIYPPDDTKPELQRFSYQNGYVYYDFVGVDGNPHTLVFDEAAMGWVWDITTPPATIHAANEGQSQQGVLVGCNDGSVRQMASNGTESIVGIVATPATGGRGYQHTGEMVCEYSSTSTITLTGYVADEGNNSYAPPPIILPATGGALTKYFFRPGANKYKLIVWQFSSYIPYILNFAGFVTYTRDWGSSAEYRPVQPFAGVGGAG